MATVERFERTIAQWLADTHEECAISGENDPRSTQFSDSMTRLRILIHVMNNYMGLVAEDDLWCYSSTEYYFKILHKNSRFTRCDSDGRSNLFDDSVEHWEADMVRMVGLTLNAMNAVSVSGPNQERYSEERTDVRLNIELETLLSVISAYCEVDAKNLRNLDTSMDLHPSGDVSYSPGGLFDVMTSGRPTW